MARRLLVTTDDFGMCHAINAGTVRAMRDGIAASSNFLVPCPWFNEALGLAFLYDRSGSVVPGIVAHGLNNAVALTLLYAGLPG